MPEQDSTPNVSRRWHVSFAGRTRGPLDEPALRAMACSGRLTRFTLLRGEGESAWRMLAAVPELSALLAELPPGEGASAAAARHHRPASWQSRLAVAAVLLLVGGYWAWQWGWIGLDLWPWYRPIIQHRRVLSERWLPRPDAYGFYLIDRGKLRPFSVSGEPVKVGPDVEFLHYEQLHNLYRAATFSRVGQDPSLGTLGESEGLIMSQLPRVRYMMRLIPARSLPPGKYQLLGVGPFFVEYETYRRRLRESMDADWKNRHWLDGIACAAQWVDASGGLTSQTAPLQREWARLLLDNLAAEPDRPTTVTFHMLKACCTWAPELKPEAAERTLKLVRGLVGQRGGVKNVVQIVKYSETISSSTAAWYGALGWEELSRRLASPVQLGREDFSWLLDMCQYYGYPPGAKEQPAYQLVQALTAYERGERAQAFSALKELAEATTETTATQVARQILAPPAVGKIEITRPPIVFKDASHRDAMKIEIKALQVGTRELEVDLAVSNLSTRRQLLSFAENGSEPGATQVGELLSITDDNGQKRQSLYGLGGGKLVAEASGNMRAVQLEPGESPEISVRFPLPSPGATRFSFAAPRYRSQSAWGWQDLPLKAGPFETPLTVLPLSNPALLKPQAAPPAAQAAKPEETAPPPASLAPETKAKASRSGNSTRKDKAAVLPPPARRGAPVSTPEPPRPPVEQERKDAPAQRAPTPAVQQGRSTVDRSKAQADALRRDVQQLRQRGQNKLNSLLKINLFASGDMQCQAAEQAYNAGNYTGAVLYFQQAIGIYKRITN